MTVVPDASLVVKWFKQENPVESTIAAHALLEDIADCRVDACWAPPTFGEVLNALHRAGRSPEAIEADLSNLHQLELLPWTLEPEMARRAAELSRDYGIDTFDAQYVAVAEEVQGVWVTFDRKAHDKIADLGLSMVPGAA